MRRTFLALAGIALLLGCIGEGGRYARTALVVAEVPPSPQHSRCYYSAEPTGITGNTIISFTASYLITNTGEDYIPPEPPAGVHLIFDGVPVVSQALPARYRTGQHLFGGPVSFIFRREFTGPKFNYANIYKSRLEIDYQLLYCEGPCADPLREGKVIYSNNTRVCEFVRLS